MNQKVMKQRLSLVVVILLVAAAGFTSCEKFDVKPIPFDATATWHFQADIQPIFNSNCVTCHNGTKQFPDLRDGKSYQALTKGGYVTLPGETSRLYRHMTTNSEHIPRSTDTEKQKVLNWINQGALNN